MQYRIIRHAEGEEREDHKYVARVLLKKASGNKPNQYRYFYDKKSYDDYLKNKEAEEVSKKSNKIGESISKIFSGKIDKQKIDDGREFINTLLDRDVSAQAKVAEVADKGKTFATEYVKDKGDAVINGAEEVKDSVKNFVKTVLTGGIGLAVASAVYNAIETIKDKIEDKKHDAEDKSEVVEIPEKKVDPETQKLVDDAYKEERELVDDWYDQSSGELFPELDHKDREYSKDEDQAAINPNYDPYAQYTAYMEGEKAYEKYLEENYEYNCSYCTAAYDLRQRGYDVEAMPIDLNNDDPTTNEEILSWYEDAELENAAQVTNRWTYSDSQSLSSEEIEKIVDHLEQNEEGSYGHLFLYWTGGGAHDVVWEIENGECIVRDCQTNETHDPRSYLYDSYFAEFFRSDNLELSPEIERVVRNRS